MTTFPSILSLLLVAIAILALSGCDKSTILSNRLIKAPGDRYFREYEKEQNVDLGGFVDSLENGIVDKDTGDLLQSPFQFRRIKLPRAEVELEIAILEARHFALTFESSYHEKKSVENGSDVLTIESSSSFECSNLFLSPELQERRGTIFLLHGYGAVKETLVPWAMYFASEGYQAILVDLRGHGGSEGKRVYFGSREADDMTELLNSLSENMSLDERVGVFGHSYGAGIGVKWAARDERVEAVFAVSPFGSVRDAIPEVMKLFGLSIDNQIIEKSLQKLEDRGRIQWEACEIYGDIETLKNPVFLVRGQHDRVATEKVLSKLMRRAPPNTRSLEIAHASHSETIDFYSDLKEPALEYFGENL